jgi:hypothetical protein
MTTRYRITIALIVGALACVVAAAPGAAQQQPNQVINSKTDPQAAGQALSDLCAALSKSTPSEKGDCQWTNDDDDVVATKGPWRILGDVEYNCSDGDEAYTESAVGVEDTREESNSVSESVSLKVSLDFFELAGSSVEAKATAEQASTFATGVKNTDAAVVPPGWKGWVQTRVLGYEVTGSAYVTDGINLIEVTGIDLDFPGFRPKDSVDTPVQYDTERQPMTADDIATNCNALNGRAAVPPPTSLSLKVCANGDCAARRVTGPAAPNVRKGTVTLTQGGRTVATGTVTRGRVAVTPRRPLEAGQYLLSLHEARKAPHRNRHRLKPPKGRRLTKQERRLRTERHRVHTRIPITIS